MADTATLESQPFEEHLKSVAQQLRGAILGLLEGVGGDTGTPRALAQRLKLDKSLAWKIRKLVGESDPAAAVSHVPGPTGLQIFLRAAGVAGAPQKSIEAVNDAVASFDQMVSVHSGDRSTLNIMLGHLAMDGQQQRLEAHRKYLFRGSSAVWGVHAKVHLMADFVAPAASGSELIDLANIRSFIDFRRLRPEVRWTMGGAAKCEDGGALVGMPVVESIDPRFEGPDAVPFLADFCSSPLPKLSLVHDRERVLYELVEGAVGNTGAVTCATGWLCREFATRYRSADDTHGAHFIRLDTPAELLIQDLFVHRDLAFAMAPEVELYSVLSDASITPVMARTGTQIPFCESVTELGWGSAMVATPDVPRYVQLVEAVFDRAGWTDTDFCAFRFKMRYPPISTVAVLRYELAERP